ncbi:hypothetical protein WA026_007299 [Henosepilachna vigintioctopunctata]|uniref:Uncharacterized protein n=1 Tax=Henosepilachna vigintioctopunctata TaxID=420089 RepID=A0AAW1ULH7_9CUCU
MQRTRSRPESPLNYERSVKRKKTSFETSAQKQKVEMNDTLNDINSQQIADILAISSSSVNRNEHEFLKPQILKNESQLTLTSFNDSLLMSEIENVIDSHTTCKNSSELSNQSFKEKNFLDHVLH